MSKSRNFYSLATEQTSKSITNLDYSRILHQLQKDVSEKDVDPGILHHLYLSLSCSRRYFAEEIPQDVVTMNSEIVLTINNNQTENIRIVYPGDVKNPGDVSVYSALGQACLGCCEKTTITYHDGFQNNTALIEKIVFQPEREKQFHL